MNVSIWEPLEVVEGDMDEIYSTSRLRIPTGWIVRHTISDTYGENFTTSMVTIEDPTHTWGQTTLGNGFSWEAK